MEAVDMRTFLGIAAGLTLASGVALAAAQGQQPVERGRIETTPGPWVADLAPEGPDGPIVRRLAVLAGRGAELGISVRDLDDQQARAGNGVIVEDVREGSAAAKAGMKKGDLVAEFDGERVRSTRQLSRLVNETPEGRAVKTAVVRDGKRVELTVTPESAAMARRDIEREFEFAVPPGEMQGLPAPDHGRHFYFDMPPGGGDRIYRRIEGRGRLGIGIEDLTPQLADYFGTKDGVLVTNVDPDTPAAHAGLKAGDVITSINGDPVNGPGQLIERVQGASDGAELSIGYVRDHKPATAKATLAPREKPKVEHRGERI
jgi:serine protease Do